MRNLFRTVFAAALLFSGPAAYAQEAKTASTAQIKPTKEERKLEQQARRLDQQASLQGGEDRVFDQLSQDLGVSTDVLKQQKQTSGLSYGNLFIANSLAKSSGMTFEQILAEHSAGKGWGQIAKDHNLRLGDVVSSTRRNANSLEAARRNAERKAARDAEARGAQTPAGSAQGRPAPAKPATPPGKGKP